MSATLKKYLVCVDGSPNSEVALRFACALAKRRSGEVILLHILEPADFQTLFALADKILEEEKAKAEGLLQKLVQVAENYCGITPTILLRVGRLGEEVIKAATEDADISMIVLGSAPARSEKGKLSSWLSTKLGETLLIPLLLVPGNLTDLQIEELA